MVYKLANVADLKGVPVPDQRSYDVLYELTSVLTNEYGSGRNVDTDDGGYVLYAAPGTPCEEVKAWFDYAAHTIEYVNRELKAAFPLCIAMYIISNEYAVTIVMSIADAPKEITEEFEYGY